MKANESLDALVVAGGWGRRMGPLGEVVSKNILPVDGQPVVVRALQAAVHLGATSCTVATGHLGDQVQDVVEACLPDLQVRFVRDASRGTALATWRYLGESPGRLLYMHANVVLAPSALRRLRETTLETRRPPGIWATSEHPIAPTHPRLTVRDGQVVGAGGPSYSVGVGLLDQPHVASLAASCQPPDGSTFEAWAFTGRPDAVSAVDLGGEWEHVENLASYRSQTRLGRMLKTHAA